MTDINSGKTALVTGATSGLGFEAAAQLAEAGYGRVTITGRSADKTDAARAELIARTGRDIFDVLTVDLGKPKSVQAASRRASPPRPQDRLPAPQCGNGERHRTGNDR